MKKWLSVVLCMVLLLTMLGCEATVKVNEPTTPANTTAPQGTEATDTPSAPTSAENPQGTEPGASDPAPAAEPLAAVILEPETEYVFDAAGETLLFSYAGQRAQVIIPTAPEAAAMIQADLNASLDQVRQSAAALKAQALAADGAAGFVTMSSVSYSPTRVDSSVISLSGTIIESTGGMHPSTLLTSASYAADTGRVLHLSDILAGEAGLEALESLILEELGKTDGKNGTAYFPEYAQTVADHLYGGNDENWYLTDEGIVFYFAPYEIAPYAAGTVLVELKYEAVSGILREELLPVRAESGQPFSIGASRSSEADLERFRNMLSLCIDEDGEQIAVFTDTQLYDVRILFHHYQEDMDITTVLLAANRLTAEDLLMISAYIPDVIPNLSVSARTGAGESRTYFISQSGMDGSILLVE